MYNINIKSSEKKGEYNVQSRKMGMFQCVRKLPKTTEENIEMDESAKIYLVGGVHLEGVSITIESECDENSVTYLVPLLEYNSEVDYYSSELEGTIYENVVWKNKKYYVFVENEE